MRIQFLAGVTLLAALAGAAEPSPEFFASHRDHFLAKLPPGSIAILHAAANPNAEVDALYRQDSDFWYLTGLLEPDSIAVLRPNASAKFVLFVRPRDFSAEQWTGWRTGIDGARNAVGADEAYAIDDFWKKLPSLIGGANELFWSDGRDSDFRARLLEAWSGRDVYSTSPRPTVAAGSILHEMRLIKDDVEQRLIRKAAETSAEAHRKAMVLAKPGHFEYEIRAALESVCTQNGALRMAYPSIVGSGPNSVLLHYEEDDRRMQSGDPIVNDSACEYSMYAADVTRSYPVGGRFSAEERAIYDIVLAAQNAGFARVKPGAEFHEVHDATVDVVVDGLLRVGILKGDRAEIIRTRAYTKYYPHGSSHWLGLDVHDVGSYEFSEPDAPRLERYSTAKRKLEPGMVFTVEPGIYIPPDAPVDPKWRNIGVRIEDDVLVTPGGMECLSCGAPRDPADVETAIGNR